MRREYPPGTIVRLVWMDDPQAPPPGTTGKVIGVDDTASLKRRCAFHPGFLLSFFLSGFPLGAGRKGSVVGGTQRAFSSRRTGAGSPGRAFALAAQKPGAGRGRWAGPPRGGRGFGAAGFSPAGNASFALVGQKSKPQNGEQKKTFRRPNVAVS